MSWCNLFITVETQIRHAVLSAPSTELWLDQQPHRISSDAGQGVNRSYWRRETQVPPVEPVPTLRNWLLKESLKFNSLHHFSVYDILNILVFTHPLIVPSNKLPLIFIPLPTCLYQHFFFTVSPYFITKFVPCNILGTCSGKKENLKLFW